MNNKLEKNLKKAEKLMKEAEIISTGDDRRQRQSLYKGIEALYYQNKFMIEQYNEIIKYLKELKK